jgi:hypothetical protein
MEIIQKLYGGEIEVRFLGPTEDKPNRHMYYVGSKRKSGATTYIGILDKSRPLVSWATDLARDYLLGKKEITEEDVYKACDLHSEFKKDAADIGKEAHKWIEGYIKGETPEMPERREAQIAVNAFLDWVKKEGFEIKSSERVVYSKEHDYMGTMDIEAMKEKKRYLIDIKTGNGIYNDAYMQTAAYVKADEEESKRRYAGRYIVRLAKETEEEYNNRMEKKNKAREIKGNARWNYGKYQPFEVLFLDNDKGNIDRDFQAFLNAKALYEWNKATDPFLNKDK